MEIASLVLVALTAGAALATVLYSRQTVGEAKDASGKLATVVDRLDDVADEVSQVADVIERSRQDQERARRRDRLVRVSELNEALQAQANALQDERQENKSWRLLYLNPLVQAGVGLANVLPSLRDLRNAHSPIDCIQLCARLRGEVDAEVRSHDGVGPTD